MSNASKALVAEADVEKISRYMTAWANTWAASPVKVTYEFLAAAPALALSTIQGTYITRRYITGGYQAEYKFKLIYRIRPGAGSSNRLAADELLNAFGDWARTETPDLGDGVRAIKVEPTSQSSKFAAYQDGYEDYQILMKLTYEVI